MPVSPVLFRNQFEDTVSPFGWSGVAVSAGCSLTANKVAPHHGAYGLLAYTPAGLAPGQFCIVYYGSMGNVYKHLFVRAMNVQFDVLPEDNTDVHGIINFFENTGSNIIAYYGCINVGGTVYWGIRRRSLGAFANVVSANTPLVNTNYCLEAEIIQSTAGNADGAVRLYVDGILEVESTGLDNDDRALNYVHFGAYTSGSPDLSDLNVRGDCVAISRMRIRCETFMMDLLGLGADKRQKTKMLSTVR
jgi:hypothetical protein